MLLPHVLGALVVALAIASVVVWRRRGARRRDFDVVSDRWIAEYRLRRPAE